MKTMHEYINDNLIRAERDGLRKNAEVLRGLLKHREDEIKYLKDLVERLTLDLAEKESKQ